MMPTVTVYGSYCITAGAFRDALYKERVEIFMTIPGVGMIAAMELLLELQDINRFQRADQLAAYVGLTPSQYSSADKIRMGRITCVGKNSLRAMLVQASWALIRKDGVMLEKYGLFIKCKKIIDINQE